MSYLLDTSVLAEVVRPRPDPDLIEWLRATKDDALHLSVLSAGELRSAAEKLPGGPQKKERRRVWLERELPAWFGERLLPVTVEISETWGRLAAGASGRVAGVEGLLAATALVHGLRLVTKGGHAFKKYPGLEVVSPWARG
jgi:predicted nucleic acid-binding protein